MVRTKPSTTRAAPKSKKKRTDQVKNRWKAKKSAQSASVLTDVRELVLVLGSSASATFSASIPLTENILGTKTRSEFKKESYESSCTIYCGTTLGVDDTLNIIVSYDGTWLTRGHSSHIGVGCAVDLLTGLCVDTHVMCTYCQVCESTGQKLFQEKPEEYAAWLVDHLDKCEVNYKGKLYLFAQKYLNRVYFKFKWKQPVSNTNKLRYTTLLSDGDSKTFTELNDIKPYGEDIHIDKEECVNHLSKRLGTALRNMVTDCRKRGVTRGGRGRGQLTGNAIRKLQIYQGRITCFVRGGGGTLNRKYYNRAIRSNKDVCSMKKAIMASLYHCFSTDENPQHELCPAGESSWCFFQEALAKHQVPGPHKHLIHTPLNEEKLAAHLLPIYERLSEEHLLSRCVSGKTQNANECLHSLIWSRCAKDHFASRSRVEFAVLTAIREFNFGPAAAADSAQFFGFQTGHHMKRLGAARMHKRVRNSLKAVRDKQSKRRDKVRAAKSKRLEELVQLEGGPAYAAGMF
ncbi:uncharacterized protein [Littorina saxatilis]|uniref:uncharacterized protein n=1 Tax=Littorina saxatilis TaxID=31220 RepID=UPI0038B472E9